jgi:hypothetical protein
MKAAARANRNRKIRAEDLLTSAILRVRFARKRVTGIDATARASVMSRHVMNDRAETPGRHQGDTRETLRRLEKQLHGPMHLWCRFARAAGGKRQDGRDPRILAR